MSSQFSRFSPLFRIRTSAQLPLHPLALQREAQLAVVKTLGRIVLGQPDAFVPQHHGAAAIGLCRDGAFEGAIGQRVILGAHRETLFLRIVARAPGHRPAQQHAVPFQPEIVVQPPGIVFLHEKAEPFGTGLTPLPGAVRWYG